MTEVIIGASEFHRFAVAKSIKMECPACGQTPMKLLTTESGRGVALIDTALVDPALDDMRPAYQMVLECQNCGHSRLFRREIVSSWLEQAQ